MALVAAMEILDAADPPSEVLSPLFHYFVARADRRYLGSLDLRSGLQAAVTAGVCTRTLHNPPMTRKGASLRPRQQAFENASRHRLVGWDPAARQMRYEVLRDPNRELEWKAVLADGSPVVIGLWLTSAYAGLSAEHPVHGLPPPAPATEGHAAVVLGFDDAKGAFRVKDSRGPSFCEQGCWWLSYGAAQLPIVDEAWAIRRITYGGN
jgi:hypothetical protein